MAQRESISVVYVTQDADSQSAWQRLLTTLPSPDYELERATIKELSSHAPDMRPEEVLLIDLPKDPETTLEFLRQRTPSPSAPSRFPPPTLTIMPTVVMVNPGDEEIAAKALALGASSYVVKDEDHRYLVLLPNILAQARLTSRARYSQHHAPYEEVGEINDQLVKMQRVLEQKNAALEQERSRRQMISEMISDYAYALRVTPTGALETEWSIGPVKEITGYSESEIESVGGIKALIHADDIERTATWLDRVQAGETKHTEYRIRTKDGTVRWIKDWGRPEFDEDGKRVLRIYGAARDVTSRKLAEGELREREERFKALVQNSTDLITVVDAKGNITYASPSHQQVLGYSPAEMEGAPLASFAHPEDAAATAAAFEAVVQNAGAGTGVDIEVRVRHKDGSWRWLLSTLTNQLHNLAIEGIVVNCRHITDRKETEEALRASEQRLRRIIEANADAIIVVDAEGNIQMTNPAAEQLFGRPTDQLVDVPFGYPLAHGSRVEMDISTPDGRHVIAEMSAVEITWEGRPAFLASLRNVTRRTQMQRALEASEEKYRSLTENLPVAVYSADPIADTTVFASSQIEELTGYSREQFLEQPGIWQQMLHPDDRKRILSRVEACHAAAEPWDLEYRILTKQGDVRWVHDKGMPSSTSSLDAELFYDGFMEDITERKLTEEFLRRFRAALDSAGDAIFLFDPDARRFVDVNRTACEQLGYSRQELLKMQPEDFTLDVNTKDIDNILRQTVGKDRLSVIEAVHQRKDGTTYPVEICIRSLPSEQAPSIIVASARDISERKRAEQALRESEERVRKIVEQSYDGIVLADPEGRIVVWNEGQEKIMGLSREEVLGRYLWDVQYQMAIDELKEAPDSYQHVKDRIVKYLRDKEDPASSRLWEQKVQRPDGVELTVQSSIFSIETQDGTMLSSISRDITTRRRMEQALRDSEQRYRALFEHAGDAIFVHDLGGRFLDVNEIACRRLGYTRDELLRMSPMAIDAPEDAALIPERMKTLQITGHIVFESIHIRKDGRPIPVEISSRRIEYDNQPAVLSIARDISERREAEAALRASEERYRLLFTSMLNGFALHEMIYDEEGRPVDYRFLQVNPAFERLTDLSAADLIGELVTDVLPDTEHSWIKRYGKVATTGQPEEFESYAGELGKYFHVTAFRPQKDQFAVVFEDITARKITQEALTWESDVNAAVADLSQALISSATLEDISWLVLRKAKQLTDSEFGYVGYIDPESGALVSASMTRDIWETCGVAEKDVVFHTFGGLWGWVLDHRRPMLTNEPAADERSTGTPKGHIPINRFLSAPAMMSDALLGQIALANPGRDYTEHDLILVKRLASLYAVAVENHRAQDALRRYAEKQAALYAIGTATATLQSPEKLLEEVIDVVIASLKADAGWIAVGEDEHREAARKIEAVVYRGVSEKTIRAAINDQGQVCPILLGVGRPDSSPSEIADVVTGCENVSPALAQDEVRTCIPIAAGGRTFGILSLVWHEPETYASDRALLKAIGQQVGVALQNARLYREARQVDRLRILTELDAALQTTLDPNEVARITLHQTVLALDAPRGSLLLCKEDNALCFDAGRRLEQAWSHPTLSQEQTEKLREILGDLDAQPALWVEEIADGDLEASRAEASSAADGSISIKSGDIIAPVIGEADVMGLIILGNRDDDRPYNEEDHTVLQAVANRAGQALRNARLYQASQRQTQRLDTLNTVSNFAAASLDPDTVLEHILNLILDAIDAEDGSILLREMNNGDAIFVASKHHEALKGETIVEGQGIAGWVVANDTGVIVNDVSQDPRFYAGVDTLTGFKTTSIICAPLHRGDTVVGVIELVNKRHGSFAPDDLELLEAVAAIASVALENARLYTRTRARAEELALLYEFGLSMTSTLSFDAVVTAALRQIQRLFQSDLVALLQPDETTDELVLVSVYADEGYLSPSARLPADTGISGWVLKHEEPLLLGNVVEDDRYWTPPDLEIPTTLRAVVAVPLLSQGEAIGVLWVGSAEADRYTREDLHTLQALASSLSIAVQNAQLYQDLRALLRERERTQAHMIHTEKMAALGRLVASLAHEINNPLQAVQGCLTLGREELGDIEIRSEDAEALAYYLNIAEDEIERISGIVRRMRDFYRPAREGMKPTNVHDVLGGIIALTNKQLQHSNVDIEREWQEDLPEVLGNADHLKQVFLNLVLNAIDAMPEGGTLTIRTGPGRMPAGEGLPDTATVRIDFKDTGSGIPKEVLSRIFEPFFTTKEHGSGLGLSISYNIIRSHNGDIIVTSEEGDGTTFTILLPVKEEPKQTSASVRRGGQHEP